MRRPDDEPLLFDLPLDRPARDDEAEPVLERQPPLPTRSSQLGQRQLRPPRRERQEGTQAQQLPQAGQRQAGQQPAGQAQAGQASVGQAPPRRSSPATGKAASPLPPDGGQSPALRSPLASAAGLAASYAQPEAAAGEVAGAAQRTGGAVGATQATGRQPGGKAGIGRRLAAGAADLLVHLAVAVLALGGCRYLGVAVGWRDWPALGIFLLSFSFLYTVVPLAFWGHTLGMTWAGLTAESLDGEPLSFDQTARRWLGALLTLAALGLPVLLSLTGRSLADRLSGSATFAN